MATDEWTERLDVMSFYSSGLTCVACHYMTESFLFNISKALRDLHSVQPLNYDLLLIISVFIIL